MRSLGLNDEEAEYWIFSSDMEGKITVNGYLGVKGALGTC